MYEGGEIHLYFGGDLQVCFGEEPHLYFGGELQVCLYDGHRECLPRDRCQWSRKDPP